MLKFLCYLIFFTLCLQTEAECGLLNFWKPAENYDFLENIKDPFIDLKQPTRAMSRIRDFDLLTLRNLYKIPQGMSIDDGLIFVISSLTQRVQSDPKNANLYYLMIGDAEHWLGHYLESEYSWTEAWQANVRSLQAYSNSSYEYSPFINILHVRDHAKWHIGRFYILTDQPVPPELKSKGRQSNKVRSKLQMEEIIKDILMSAPIGNSLRRDAELDQNLQEKNSVINSCSEIFLI